ncbi:MAG: hypothetical protein WC824_06555 [Bacteroidota bacterium]|jgi:hypothetical protein
MKPFILLILILASIGACAQKEDDGIAIPGVTPSDVYHSYPDEGMLMHESWNRTTYRTILTAYMGGIQYDIVIIGRNASVVDSVWVGLKADSTLSNALKSQQYFRVVAATPYEGSDPDGIEKWLTDHYGDREARTTVGPVEYILRAPSDFEREMTMTRVR